VDDLELRRKLTPDYALGCKRLLLSNSYYPSLTAANVDVHAGSLERIEGSTLVGSDGSRVEVDALVFSTGFHILDMPIANRVFGAAGQSLSERWAGSPTAYLGTTVAGFPNLFLLLGPSLGTGHSSAFTILEAQLDYVSRALERMQTARIEAIDVRQEVLRAYVADVQSALPRTVYASGGCVSYYVDENGKNTFSWPWSTDALTARVGRFDLEAYEVVSPAQQVRTVRERCAS
jgi:cation diffusion facilitator CzcD-associated flavoprotein CzcO